MNQKQNANFGRKWQLFEVNWICSLIRSYAGARDEDPQETGGGSAERDW